MCQAPSRPDLANPETLKKVGPAGCVVGELRENPAVTISFSKCSDHLLSTHTGYSSCRPTGDTREALHGRLAVTNGSRVLAIRVGPAIREKGKAESTAGMRRKSQIWASCAHCSHSLRKKHKRQGNKFRRWALPSGTPRVRAPALLQTICGFSKSRLLFSLVHLSC